MDAAPSSPAVACDTNGRDGAASEADLTFEKVDSDAQQPNDPSDIFGVRCLDAVAALDWAGVALRGGGSASRGGNNDSCESESNDGGLELHVGDSWEV